MTPRVRGRDRVRVRRVPLVVNDPPRARARLPGRGPHNLGTR